MNGSDHKLVGIGFGIATSCIATQCLGCSYATVPIIMATSYAGSALPDIDHDKTKVGKKRKAITDFTTKTLTALLVGGGIAAIALVVLSAYQVVDSGIDMRLLLFGGIGSLLLVILAKTVMSTKTMKWVTKHRGIMHTMFVPIMLFVAWRSTTAEIISTMILGTLAGYLSHLWADMHTMLGCPILWPISKYGVRVKKYTSGTPPCRACAVRMLIVDSLIGFVIAYLWNFFH